MYGKILAELRKEKGLSQRELANLLEIGNSTLAMYELENRKPDLDTLIKLSNFFDASIDYMLGQSEDRHSHKKGNPDFNEIEALKTALTKANILPTNRTLTKEEGQEILKYSKYILQPQDKKT